MFFKVSVFVFSNAAVHFPTDGFLLLFQFASVSDYNLFICFCQILPQLIFLPYVFFRFEKERERGFNVK